MVMRIIIKMIIQEMILEAIHVDQVINLYQEIITVTTKIMMIGNMKYLLDS